jgi:SAM-dependent methyltransferase
LHPVTVMKQITTGLMGLALAMRESLARTRMKRQPEPDPVMNDAENVSCFHAQGDGPLLPVYHFNALAMARMVAERGTVLDLGCGSGRYLRYFAGMRPDVRIIGLDLSAPMLEAGREMIRSEGLETRVELRTGDMTDFAGAVTEPIDFISSVYSLHHLPDASSLVRCLDQIRAVRGKYGCGVWIFDHVRPRLARTAERFPEVVTPDAPGAFRRDSANSLKASFSFGSLSRHLDEAGMGMFRHEQSRFFRILQAHWIDGSPGRVPTALPKPLQSAAERDFRMLRLAFPGLRVK